MCKGVSVKDNQRSRRGEMRTLAMCGASCKRRSFFYCTGAAWKSLQLLPLLMVEGCVGRSWVVWDGAMLNFAITEFSELRLLGIPGSSLLGMLRAVGHGGTFEGLGSLL